MAVAKAIEAEAQGAQESPAMNAILGANPFVEVRGSELLASFAEIARKLLARPDQLWLRAAKFAGELAAIVTGSGEPQPQAGDRRFADPAWQDNPFYRRLMQFYLAWRAATHGLLDLTEDTDWKGVAQRRFALTLLTEALAPTNTLLGNPAALKRVFDTAGMSLVDGLRNFWDDLLHNGGMPSQVDKRPFKVGKTLATTPGTVIFRNELCELLQYTPTTREVRSRPLLLVPPQINKFYIMDLAPKRSLTEYAVARGIQFFTISWRNPGPEYRERNLNDYVGAIKEVIGVVSSLTGSPDVNLLAVCAGGITSSLLLGHLAASGDPRVKCATLVVTMLDTSEPSMTATFATEDNVRASIERSSRQGVLDAASLSRTFAWLRPNDLVWHYWVNNYLMGQDPAPFDILYWNSDSTNLPAALHADFLNLLLKNSLVQAGQLKILGTPIDLRKVTCDTYVLAGQTDHICPWQACYGASRLFGGETEFVLNASGHVQSLVSPPGNFKSRYFTNTHRGVSADQWLAGSAEHRGSWWDHWLDWLERRSGDLRSAPEGAGNSVYLPMGAAPGSYVMQKP
jgi:polyhydroxyalkanoate synthase